MTGWRLGWVVAPERHVRDLEKLAQNLYISPATVSQRAALACFEPATLALLEERRQAFRARRDYLVPALRELGFGIPVMPGGGFFVYADCSRFSQRQPRVLPRRAGGDRRRHHPRHRLRHAPRARARPLRLHDRRWRSSRMAWPRLRAPSAVAAAIAVTRGALRAAMAGAGDRLRRSLVAAADPTSSGRARPGRSDLIAGARPVDDVLASTDDPRLAHRLRRAREIRAFASRELALPRQPQLLALHRPRPALRRLERVRRAGALARAAASGASRWRAASAIAATSARRTRRRRPRGSRRWATTSTSAACRRIRRSAGSTTRCSRRSSAIRTPRWRALVFHELAHQVVYVKDDTSFNEAFATAVEEAGLARWLAAQAGTPGHAALRRRSGARQAAARGIPAVDARGACASSRRSTRAARATRSSARARPRYSSACAPRTTRAKAGESGLAGYDRWFAGHDGRGPNNASLAAVALYDDKVPAFRALLAAGRRRPAGVLRTGPRTRRPAQGRARGDPARRQSATGPGCRVVSRCLTRSRCVADRGSAALGSPQCVAGRLPGRGPHQAESRL